MDYKVGAGHARLRIGLHIATQKKGEGIREMGPVDGKKETKKKDGRTEG